MIGFVIVSHSAKLAEGVRELAVQMADGRVRIAAAGGTSDPDHPIGTDAFRVVEAIESVFSVDGVLVFTDLGSAVLSAETALEFVDEARRPHVRICDAPLVEGVVAAVSQAAAGATVEEILRETRPGGVESVPSFSASVIVTNEHGLHARPAAQFIRIARGFDARIMVENVTTHAGPVDAQGINGLLSVGARRGHELRIGAAGIDAERAASALVEFVARGCGDTDRPQRATAVEFGCVGASPGIAVGPVLWLRRAAAEVECLAVQDPDAEWQRLQRAIHIALDQIRGVGEWVRSHAGDLEAGIFDAQSMFLEDASLIASASRLVHEERRNAEFAWKSATDAAAEKLSALEDPYQRARAADVKDVSMRVLRVLIGAGFVAASFRGPAIVAAHDVAPSEVRDFDPAAVLGVCLEEGSPTAHSAILLRALGIPAVVGIGPGLASVSEGTALALDGETGEIWISPDADRISDLEQRRKESHVRRRNAAAVKHRPGCTRDGKRIAVVANLSRDFDVMDALENGAEGVGVLRTEFLFLNRKEPPSEEEQVAAYRTIADALAGRPLVIRTLDIGGDKPAPYVRVEQEANPFLGWRGVRLMLGSPELLRTQLRAIARAAHERNVEVLLPMVSMVSELRGVKAMLAELDSEMRVGVMVEVPAAVAIADQLAREASRLSIGTNDLVQYVMAADRTNARVAGIADHFQPAVLRSIRDTFGAGRRAGIPVDVCGEMAADPLATGLLIGLGVDELSVSPAFIPEVKRALRLWTVAEAEAIAHEALEQESSEAVRRLLKAARRT